MREDFDVIVIGGGSAGFAAAGRAVAHGAHTALVEAGPLGGDCPNRACVPTKILSRSAEILHLMRHAEEFGVKAEKISLDLGAVMARKDRVIGQLTGERLNQILDRRGISLFTDRARFISSNQLKFDGKTVSSAKFIIASGSRPHIPAIPGLAETGYITSEQAIGMTEVPESVAIVGGGAVGLEFAQIYSRFGAKTTVIETGGRLLGREDAEIAELLRQYLLDEGVDVLTGATVKSAALTPAGKALIMETDAGDREVVVEEILVAAGRTPNVDDLGLDAAGVDFDNRGIKVDDTLKTSADNIWACGDVTGRHLYTHVATYQGDLAGYNSVDDRPDRADYTIIPRVIFAGPEVAAVGLTESEAGRDLAHAVTGRMPYRYLGKSLMTGDRRGLIKIVADFHSRLIVGGQIIGVEAGELIHEIAVAMKTGMTVESLSEVIHAYPSFAEGIEVAAAEIVLAQEAAAEEAA